MTNGNSERAEKHLERIMKLAAEAGFTNCRRVPTTPLPQISISQAGKYRTHSVHIAPTGDFLADENANFDELVKKGLKIAKNVINNPSFPDDDFQGRIVLGHRVVEFQEKGSKKFQVTLS